MQKIRSEYPGCLTIYNALGCSLCVFMFPKGTCLTSRIQKQPAFSCCLQGVDPEKVVERLDLMGELVFDILQIRF